MLKAILFDMDGVIIDSEPLHARAAILAMERYGIHLSMEFCYSFIGSTAKHMLEVIKENYQLNVSIEELMEANRLAKKELLQTEGYPAIPFVKELMEALHLKGFLLAIASSSPMEEIEETVQMLGLAPYLDRLVSGMQVEKPKPAPDIFLAAAKELSVLPSECIVIEDSFNGLCAAYAAGMTKIAFYNPNSGSQDLSGADYVIEGFEEVGPDIIEMVYQHAHGQPAVIGKTKRLVVRELSMEDIPVLHQLLDEPGIRELAGIPERTLKEELELHKAYIKNSYHFRGYGFWGIFLKSDDRLIGYCGIQDSDIDGYPEVELGYLLAPAFRKTGYAKECARFVLDYAFSKLGLLRIAAAIPPENTPSLQLAQRLGMHYEKTIWHNGQEAMLYIKIK